MDLDKKTPREERVKLLTESLAKQAVGCLAVAARQKDSTGYEQVGLHLSLGHANTGKQYNFFLNFEQAGRLLEAIERHVKRLEEIES